MSYASKIDVQPDFIDECWFRGMGAKPPYKPYKPQGEGGGTNPDPHISQKIKIRCGVATPETFRMNFTF